MSFFFFQAEDGIRDHCVTGVQTCALPIYHTDTMLLGYLPKQRVLIEADVYNPTPANAPAAPPTKENINLNDKDRKSTRLNSSHTVISYAVFCLKKKKINK